MTATSEPATTEPTHIPEISTLIPLDELVVWVTVEFDPDPSTPAGELFANRLQSFNDSHPDLTLTIRVKNRDGPSGIIETLIAARNAAPSALPDLIALDQTDLEVASRQGLIMPINNAFGDFSTEGWYGFSLEAAQIDGVLYGVPFAGDTEVLAYRTDIHSVPPLTWSELADSPGNFLFPAKEPNAGFVLAQYLALGGRLTDDDGRPTLDALILEEVFAFLASLRNSGILTPTSLQHTSSRSTWSNFKDGRVATALAPFSDFAKDHNPEDSSAVAIPSRNAGYALTRSWYWAISAKRSEGSTYAVELLQWLSEAEFLGAWTQAMGMLPISQSSLALWPENDATAVASQVVTVSQRYPAEELIDIIGPALAEATRSIILDLDSPESAAASAVEMVNPP